MPPPPRTLIHNPNYQSTHAQPPSSEPSYLAYPPVSQPPQHPVHIPFSTVDPYPTARRDPFLPTVACHGRRSSHGVVGQDRGAAGERHGDWDYAAPNGSSMSSQHVHHHHQRSFSGSARPPPPPSSRNTVHDHPASHYDASRRRSLGAASPTSSYRALAHDFPPPPPSFRPMPPPPSPPHPSHTNYAPPTQRLLGRDLPAVNRPGSMSISSLIGGDASPSAAASQSHTSSSVMQPPSPRHTAPSAGRSDIPQYRRPPSPERHPYGNTAFAAGSPPRHYNGQQSPEQGRPSQSLPHHEPYRPMLFQNHRAYNAAPRDGHPQTQRSPSSGIPPRPNSQPGQIGSATDGRDAYGPSGVRGSAYGPQEERRRTLGESHHVRPNIDELVRGSLHSAVDKGRPSTVQPLSQAAYSPPRDFRSTLGPSQLPQQDAWRRSEDAPRGPTDNKRAEPPVPQRNFGGYSAPPQGPAPFGGPAPGPEDMVRGRSLDHLSHRMTEHYQAPPTSDPNSMDKPRTEPMSRSLSSRSMYEQHRRTGRASPLPQAVQGAQAQPLSIGKDPHVKSEFGRMFSGLGGLGSSTPSRGSPMPPGVSESFPPGIDLNEHLRLQRVSSQNGRKPKRVKDEDGSFDNEMNDGRGTPVGMRGAKRNKHAHAGHHHHHHAHHHHHHHHRPDEEYVPSAASSSLGARQGTIPPGPGPAPQHHHHHHHGAPHHHHHAPRPAQPAPVAAKLPIVVHNIQFILDEAAKYPRRHLGSQLYEAIPELPRPNSSVDDQFGYASRPKPLPRFETNPINCTFTIRVPRFYLKPRQRQQIVLQRHLWGARIYRDNSDPIAAAIHSGWMRGEWDDTVDVNQLDPRITAPSEPGDAAETLTKPPRAPVVPPADMDLQLEILILPRIDAYAGTVEYGISSRKKRQHEGLSFVVHKLRWVEEGVGSRGQERTAAALKKRLDASAALMALMQGPGGAGREANGGMGGMKGTTALHV